VRLLYYRAEGGNFGDDLNPWLWPQFLGPLLDDDPRDRLIGIGSIIRNWSERGTRHVLGAGVGYRRLDWRDAEPRAWRFHAVRGPLTAHALGLEPALALTDPALLVRRMPLPAAPAARRATFMPHHVGAAQRPWAAIADAAGLDCIDPRWEPLRVVQAIRGSTLLVTEALHGAIVADAFGVPWVPVKLHERILQLKWSDWSLSVGVTHRFEQPAAGSLLARWLALPGRFFGNEMERPAAELTAFLQLAARAEPRASAPGVLDALEERLLARIEGLRRERR
jgi:succinoglycan biosynthesis protein ExoV